MTPRSRRPAGLLFGLLVAVALPVATATASMPVAVDFGLRADGKLAVSVEGNVSATTRAAVIGWYSPAEPVAHVLPQPQIAAST